MCGIFAFFNNLKYKKEVIKLMFMEGKSRGPEDSQLHCIDVYNMFLGFHRLAIEIKMQISHFTSITFG